MDDFIGIPEFGNTEVVERGKQGAGAGRDEFKTALLGQFLPFFNAIIILMLIWIPAGFYVGSRTAAKDFSAHELEKVLPFIMHGWKSY